MSATSTLKTQRLNAGDPTRVYAMKSEFGSVYHVSCWREHEDHGRWHGHTLFATPMHKRPSGRCGRCQQPFRTTYSK